MSLSRRPDPKRNVQPVLWAEGRQQPRFDLRAFGRVSLLISRERVGPLLTATARHLGMAGSSVATGRTRIPEHRLGHSGQWLPSHQSVGAGISGLGAICAQAGEMVLPPPAPVEPLAYPDLLSLAPKHRRAVERLADLPRPAEPDSALRQPAKAEPITTKTADFANSDPEPAKSAAPEPPPRVRRERLKSPLRDVTPAEPKPAEADAELLAIRAMLAEVQATPARPALAQLPPIAPPRPRTAQTAAFSAHNTLPTRAVTWQEEIPDSAPVSLSVPKRGKSFVMAFLRYLGRGCKRMGLWALRHPKTRAAALKLRAFLTTAIARGLGWVLTTLALPYGAFKAMMLHLNGEDLRRWE